MNTEWSKIRKIIEDGDESAIEEAKRIILENMEKISDLFLESGGSLRGITASTFQDNELRLNQNKSDLILLFRQELLYTFMKRHGMSLYRDTHNIKAGDSIVIKQNNKMLAYDVIASAYPNISVRLVKFIKGDTPKDIVTIEITKCNFMFGIGPDIESLKVNQKLFFFFM